MGQNRGDIHLWRARGSAQPAGGRIVNRIIFLTAFLGTAGATEGGNPPEAQAPVPAGGQQRAAAADRYLAAVRDFADAMLRHGRDTYGPVRSPLFASALDLESLKIPADSPPAPEGDFLARSETLADAALAAFFREAKIPRASTQHAHYEAITRADTLVLALLEVWSLRTRPENPLAFSWIDR